MECVGEEIHVDITARLPLSHDILLKIFIFILLQSFYYTAKFLFYGEFFILWRNFYYYGISYFAAVNLFYGGKFVLRQ